MITLETATICESRVCSGQVGSDSLFRYFEFRKKKANADTSTSGGWCCPRSQKRDLRSKDMNPSLGPRTWGARLIQRYNEDTPEFVVSHHAAMKLRHGWGTQVDGVPVVISQLSEGRSGAPGRSCEYGSVQPFITLDSSDEAAGCRIVRTRSPGLLRAHPIRRQPARFAASARRRSGSRRRHP
jgi:hypothetical protein